ncbi:MAG: metallophosphoesterase [Planctomycetota bacterium]
MPGQARTLILSDTHLGRPGRVTVAALRPLWQGFDHLIINGDAVELQMPSCRAAGARAVDTLQDAADRDGVALTLISGNHDAYLSDLRYLYLLEGRVLLTHGDVLHPTIVPWTSHATVLAEQHAEAMARATPTQRGCMDFRHDLSQRLSYRERMGIRADGKDPGLNKLHNALLHPIKVAQVLAYWRSIPALVHRLVEQCAPGVEMVVLGHTHRQGVWNKHGRSILNCGSFDRPGRPRAVVVEGRTVSMHRIKWSGQAFQRMEKPVYVQRFTPPQPAANTVAAPEHEPIAA